MLVIESELNNPSGLSKIHCKCGHKQLLWFTRDNYCVECRSKIEPEAYKLLDDSVHRYNFHNKEKMK